MSSIGHSTNGVTDVDNNENDPNKLADGIHRYIRKCKAMIEEHGHIVQSIPGEQSVPTFSYSVGLTLKRLPEFLLIGLSPEIASVVINGMAKRFAENPAIASEPIEGLVSVPVRLRELSMEAALVHCKVIRPVLGRTPDRIFQIIWPDPDGHFPHEPGYRHLVRQSLDELNPIRAS